MSLVIDMNTRAVLHSSGDDREEPAPAAASHACELRLVEIEPDRLELWRKWVPGLFPVDSDGPADDGE